MPFIAYISRVPPTISSNSHLPLSLLVLVIFFIRGKKESMIHQKLLWQRFPTRALAGLDFLHTHHNFPLDGCNVPGETINHYNS